MTFPGTIPQILLSREWGRATGTVSGRSADDGFVNSAVRLNSHLRILGRELLRELFSPRNRKKCVHNLLLKFFSPRNS